MEDENQCEFWPARIHPRIHWRQGTATGQQPDETAAPAISGWDSCFASCRASQADGRRWGSTPFKPLLVKFVSRRSRARVMEVRKRPRVRRGRRRHDDDGYGGNEGVADELDSGKEQ